MIRRNLATGLMGLMVAAMAASVISPAMAFTEQDLHEQATALMAREMVPKPGHVGLRYDDSLTPAEIIARAETDAQSLGLPLVRTMAAGRIAIVQGEPADVAARLEALEGAPIVGTTPVYSIEGSLDPDRVVVFTDRMLLNFQPGLSESAKRQWLTAQGLTRLMETANGGMVVSAPGEPGVAMATLAEQLKASHSVLESATPEAVAIAHLLAGDSLILNDPLFKHQWPLANLKGNTTGGEGRVDNDLDAPRAWMVNQYNIRNSPETSARTPFGWQDVSVAVFDRGVQITHEDIASNLDPNVGRDFVSNGNPVPTLLQVNVHGTAMASLIAGSRNSTGIVGVAPAVRTYAVRVIADDGSFSSTNMQIALEDTIVKNVDVNLHSYRTTFDMFSALATPIETGLRQTFESGRNGLGIVNVAAAGDFYSQVDYPAHSQYCYAVSGFDSRGGLFTKSNWGGLGVDFVMPSASGFSSRTGIVTADFMGAFGYANASNGGPGNPNGNYVAVGSVSSLASTDADDTSNLGGSSIAAAHAAGVVAMMLSDRRFGDRSPHTLPSSAISRAARKSRVQPGSDNILGLLYAHAELPGTSKASIVNSYAFNYVNRHNERAGYGMPNPARFASINTDTAAEATKGRGTPDTVFVGEDRADGRTSFAPTVLVDWQFGLSVPPPAPDADEEAIAEYLQALKDARLGWKADPAAQIMVEVPVDGGGTVPLELSPAFYPINSYVMEDQAVVAEEAPMYVWGDSLPLGFGDPEQEEDPNNLLWNPDGRYQAGQKVGLLSPELELRDLRGVTYHGQPMILTLKIAHGLAVENASGLTVDDEAETATANGVFTSPDRLIVEYHPMTVTYDGPTSNATRQPIVEVGQITGDSRMRYKDRLISATGVYDDEFGGRPIWPRVDPTSRYQPWVSDAQMVVRTYRFVLPGTGVKDNLAPQLTALQIGLRLESDASILPSYGPPDDSGEFEELLNVNRDDNGFLLLGAKVEMMSLNYYLNLVKTNYLISTSSRMAEWSAAGNEVLLASSDRTTGTGLLSVTDSRPTYYNTSTSGTEWRERPQPIDGYHLLGETITGMRIHPSNDVLAITTASGESGSLYVVTTDGVQQTRIVNPQLTVGARDPRWAATGRQLIYAGPDYVRLVTFTSSDPIPDPLSVTTETLILTEDTGLSDFRSPVWHPNGGGLFYFLARSEGSDTHNLYVATRNGRVFNYPDFSGCDAGPTREPEGPFLFGWETANILELEISHVGHRLLMVVAAARNPVVPSNCVDPGETGGTAVPADPASNSTGLVSIDNWQNVLMSNDPPVYTWIELDRTVLAEPDLERFVHFPRIAPYNAQLGHQEMLFTTYREVQDLDNPGLGRVIRQKLPPEVITDPIRDVTQPPFTPPATPVPGVDPQPGHVATTGAVSFASNAQGWGFRHAAPDLDQPLADYNTAAGALELRSNNSNFTFGFFESPTGLMNVRDGSLFLARATARATPGIAADKAPTLRLRVNSVNHESAFTTEATSLGDLSLAANSSASRTFDLMFRPAPGWETLATDRRNYTMSFDLLNFFRDDDPNGGLLLENLEFFRLDDGGRHVAVFSLRVPDSADATVDFSAVGLGLRPDSLGMTVRRCLLDAETEIGCVSGSGQAGVALAGVTLERGTIYTVLVTSRYDQDIRFDYRVTNGVSLEEADGNNGSVDTVPCVTSPFATEGTPLSGTTGSVTVRTSYMADGTIMAPSCESPAARTVVNGYELVYDANFSDPATRALWYSGPNPLEVEYTNPDFVSLSDSLGLRVLDPANTFGYWTADANTIPVDNRAADVNGMAIYRATFTIANDFESVVSRLPALRVRFATGDFQMSSAAQLAYVNDGAYLPTPGRPRNVEVYLVLPRVPSTFSTFVAGFDVLSFAARDITPQPMQLKALRIERLRINDFPTP